MHHRFRDKEFLNQLMIKQKPYLVKVFVKGEEFNILKLVLFFFTFLYYSSSVCADDYVVNVRHLNEADGISHKQVLCIHQDLNGFMWMGTKYGLNRYDGHDFLWFTREQNGLQSNYISKVFQGEGDWLWLINAEEKFGAETFFTIDLIHSVTFEIKQFGNGMNENLPFKFSEIRNLTNMPDGRFIFSLKNSDHYLYSLNEQFIRLPFNENINILLALANDSVWGTTGNELLRLNIEGEIIQSLPMKTNEIARTLYRDNHDRIWLITGEENENKKTLYENARIYVVSGDVFIPVLTDAGLNNPNEITLVPFKQDNATLIFHNVEVFEVDNNLNVSYHNPTILEENPFQLGKCFAADRNGVIWYGHRDGFWMFDFQPRRFIQYLKNENDGLYPVRGIAEYGRYLFVNSSIDGSYLDLKTNTLYSYTEGYPRFKFNKCFPMIVTKNGELWTANDCLNQLDSSGKIVQVIKMPLDEQMRIWSFLQDRNDTWWMGVGREFIYHYDAADQNEPQLFTRYNGFETLKMAEKWQFVEEDNGMWIAAQNGLYFMDYQKGIVSRYGMQEPDRHYLPANQFHNIYKDRDGAYWLATGDAGLIKVALDSAGNIHLLKHLTRGLGLPSNELYAIYKDDFGFFWISSANGLIRYDEKSGLLDVFYEEQGITNNEFNRLSYFQSSSGRIYFGGLNGVTAFDPKDFTEPESYNVPLTWAAIKIFSGETDSLKDITWSVLKNKEIVYRPGDKFITIRLSLQDYFYSNRVKYSYMIEGLNDSWTEISSNTLQLSGIPYGDYILRVRAKGFGNRISTSQPEIRIVSQKPFYLQWWFIHVFVAAVLISLAHIYLWRVQTLKKRQVMLEKTVADRTKKILKDKETIKMQADQLRELDEMKSRFFANISHELRTPLTLILGPLENVLKRDHLEKRDQRLLSMILQNGRQLLKRINELLDLSRLDAKKMELHQQPVLINPLVKKIISEFESAAAIKNIMLSLQNELNPGVQLLIDQNKFESVLANFLSNAVKFTPANGHIGVKLTRFKEYLHMSVADSGPGIHEEDLEKVFDRYYKSSHHEQAGGTGIGLALVREFTILMNGRVWVESEVGKGSVFFMEIPYEEFFAPLPEKNIEDVQISITAPEVSVPNDTGETILVVEDNLNLLDYMKIILEDYQVISATNGKEALDRLSENPAVNLIISDIMMPVMDGLELLKSLRENDFYRHIPVIMLTARQNMETKLEALRIGVDDYMVKPFREAELQARVINLLTYRRNRAVAENPDGSSVAESTPGTLSRADIKWLETVEKILLENIENTQFNLSWLADEMALGMRRFQQKIKAITGLTPKEYQREIQLELARRMLESGDYQTVSEVSLRVGFKDTHYFSNLFLKRFGKKPGEYL